MARARRHDDDLIMRLDRIERCLYGNGESIIERLARLEEQFRGYIVRSENLLRESFERQQIDLQRAIKELLQTQVVGQMQSTVLQRWGLVVAIVAALASGVFFLLSWAK